MKFVGSKYTKGLVYSLGVVSILTLFFGYRAMATPAALSLTTSPVLLNLNVSPGSSSVQTIELMNNTSNPVPIKMELMTFGAAGSTGQADITNFPSNVPDASYVKLSPTNFVAQPKVWNKVQVSVSLPSSASLGYYYAIVFQPVYPNSSTNSGAVIHGSNAILALVNTNSANEKRTVQIASFRVSKRIYEYLPASFNVNIHNNGNIYLAPHGDIFVSRSYGGKSLAVLPVNGGNGNVLPNSDRIFTANWSDGFPVYKPVTKNGQPELNKSGQTVNKLDWNFNNLNHFRFGRYYATLVMTYSTGTKTVVLNAQLDFWVIPWLILLVILVIVLIILLNLFFIARSIYRKFHKGKTKKPVL